MTDEPPSKKMALIRYPQYETDRAARQGALVAAHFALLIPFQAMSVRALHRLLV